MIEKLTADELIELLNDLKRSNIGFKEMPKHDLVQEEMKKLYGDNAHVCESVYTPIYHLADWAFDNFEKRCNSTYRRMTVPQHLIDDYSAFVRVILELLRPCYGRVGFRGGHASKIEADEARGKKEYIWSKEAYTAGGGQK